MSVYRKFIHILHVQNIMVFTSPPVHLVHFKDPFPMCTYKYVSLTLPFTNLTRHLFYHRYYLSLVFLLIIFSSYNF